jgi:nucleoside-diphosphate-sugar epimerase
MPHKLIVGCGYLGSRVAERWLKAGDTVHVITRSAHRAVDLAGAGLLPIVADIAGVEPLPTLPAVETMLFAVGYDRKSGQSIHDVYVGGLRHVLAALADKQPRFIYISSTGVYGPASGQWVTEETPCAPQREGGQACWEAERLVAHRAIVLRLAGIYGPDRIPLRDAIVAGEPIAAPAEGYLNLIHVDDAASAVLAAEAKATASSVYNVSDGHPGQRREYYQELARLLGAPEPLFTTPDPDSPAAKRASADKRVSNARMLAELGVELRHPSFHEGLAAIVAGKN